MTVRYVVDKRALARMPPAPVRARLGPIIKAGEAATCAITDLEILFSACNHAEHERIRARRALSYALVPMTQEIFQRAIEVPGLRAKDGHHRLPIADLIVVAAAAAESAGLSMVSFARVGHVRAQGTGRRARHVHGCRDWDDRPIQLWTASWAARCRGSGTVPGSGREPRPQGL